MLDMDIAWLERERPLEFDQRLALAAGVGEHDGEIIGGDGVFRIGAAGLLHAVDRIFGAAQTREEQAFLMMGNSMIGHDGEQGVPLRDGTGQVAALGHDAGENGEDAFNAIAPINHHPVAVFGGSKVSGTLEFHGFMQQASGDNDLILNARHASSLQRLGSAFGD